MDRQALGHLRHIVNLSRQIPGDWSDMGPYDPTQEGDDAYRYQLAYMVYVLGLVQYHHTPAYRELWRDTTERLIEKMMRWEVWGYWELTSRGSKVLDPDLDRLGDGWIDPVIRQNVMYSGHLLMMVGLYEMLYRTGRYDRPGSLTFQFRPVFRGMGPEDFPYDHGRLAQAIFAEFQRNNFLGCECEPNAIFVYCNQFPMLGFLHYDLTHASDLAARTIPAFRESWQSRSTMFCKSTDTDLPIFYRLRQDDFIYEESEDNNEGITAVAWASVMHAWAKDYVEAVYPRARDQILREVAQGMLAVNLKGYHARHVAYQERPGHDATDPMMVGVHIFGTLALAAAEVGDTATVQGLLAFADQHMQPTWKNGGLFYPRHDDLASERYTTALVGNALLAGARLCPRDGFHALYNHPWDEQALNRPELCGIDYPRIEVAAATYPDNAVIAFTLVCEDCLAEPATMTIRRLEAGRAVTVLVEGMAALTLEPAGEAVSAGLLQCRRDGADGLAIALGFKGRASVRLRYC